MINSPTIPYPHKLSAMAWAIEFRSVQMIYRISYNFPLMSSNHKNKYSLKVVSTYDHFTYLIYNACYNVVLSYNKHTKRVQIGQ